MSYDYISTFDDYKAAQKLYLRSRPKARIRLLGWMYGLPVATAVLVFILWRGSRGSDWSGFSILTWLTVVCFFLTVQVVVLRPWNLRRCYKRLRKVSGLTDSTTIRFEFDDNGVVSGIAGRSEGRFFWSGIQDFVENDKIALLFIGSKRFLYIPKRAMADEQWTQLRSLAAEKISPPA